ncbi:hypothetical protein MG295_00164 [Bacillus phage vB_BcgM]|nr:hypothetical protein MG295_00164 [Bacillus phage vB_BcgM]
MALSPELETLFMLEEVVNKSGIAMEDVVIVVKEWEKQKEKNKENEGDLF